MKDIEVKRKELETAKRIRDNGYNCCTLDPYLYCAECPVCNGERCTKNDDFSWDAFISTREAELAEMEKTEVAHQAPVCEKCGGAGFYYIKGATTMEAVKRACECQAHSPTLDDFALALIQGGYFNMTMGEEAAIENLVSRAGKIKSELDRRRGE